MAHRRRHRAEFKAEEMNMAAMIDVVFQIMIYFLVTYKAPALLTRVPVTRPAAPPTPAPNSNPPKIRITVLRDGYLVNERPANLETMTEWLGSLARLDTTQPIVINVAAKSEHSMLMNVLDVCVGVKLTNFALFTIE